MPQPASCRTIPGSHRVKQGVKALPKTKVTRRFILPDGQVRAEVELTAEEYAAFCQKVCDLFTPLLYEAVLEDIRREQQAGA